MNEHTLPSHCGAKLETDEHYVVTVSPQDAADFSISSPQLLSNYLPPNAKIIRATGARTYVYDDIALSSIEDMRSQRGLAPAFASTKGNVSNPLRPERRAQMQDGSDNEFEDVPDRRDEVKETLSTKEHKASTPNAIIKPDAKPDVVVSHEDKPPVDEPTDSPAETAESFEDEELAGFS